MTVKFALSFVLNYSKDVKEEIQRLNNEMYGENVEKQNAKKVLEALNIVSRMCMMISEVRFPVIFCIQR